MKLAVWSGPRNISTAMMYAFGNRPDFAAWDEPFYAAYLAETGIDHPLREQVLAAHETDPHEVARAISGPTPGGKAHWYLKVMPFQMLVGFPFDWADDCTHIHLIRHPARVIASYAAKRESPTLDDIGYAHHAPMFERFPGPVLDSADIRANPREMLGRLCDIIGLSFDDRMLSWPSGPRDFDGAWASHWYDAVHRSTGFAGPEGSLPILTGANRDLLDQALPYWQRLHEKRLRLAE